ncbi:MAG: O-antigen ligase family protein [Bacteroidales bacterium]|jgi:hypothetical protein|nr:O-antigen ligase family protein [Bacteroidales bacterium]
MNINIINKRDKTLSFSIFLFFFIQTFNGAIKLIFEFSESQNSLISNLFGGIYMFYFISKVLPIVFKRRKKTLILSYLCFGILYLISTVLILNRGEKTDWLLNYYGLWTFAFWIPVGISAYSIYNYKILYEVLMKYSYTLSFLLVVVFIKIIFVMSEEQERFYSMFFSYLMLIPAILHLSHFFYCRKRKILYIALGEIIMILLIGSRGSIICLSTFVLIKYLFSNKTTFFKITRLGLVVLILSIVYFNLGNINDSLISNFNIYSRNLNSFSNNESDLLHNRIPAWLAALNLIKEKPFVGYGIGGDYYPMSKMSVLIDSRYGAGSPHNGFLQLMMFFGVPIGLSLGIWLFFSILKIRKNYSFQHRELLIITFSIFIIPSMTIGDGIFVKPGIALYIYMLLKYNSKNIFNDSVSNNKNTQYETSM